VSSESELIQAGDFIPSYYRQTIANFLQVEDLSPICILFLIVVEIAVDLEGDNSSISTKDIADWIGCSLRSVHGARNTLIERGLITVEDYAGMPNPLYGINYPDDTDKLPGDLEL